MLKFLTHKLRTHSLNEDQLNHYKADDDHDSGTESDDEIGDSEDQESVMESEAERSSSSTISPSPYSACLKAYSPASPYFLDSALPSDSDHNYDHHSSEEELEVINSSSNCSSKHIKELLTTSRSGSVTVPEKRKWSQITHDRGKTNCDRARLAASSSSCSAHADHSSGSSDEEVQGLLAAMATPVQFRTSPPLTAHKPGHKSLSPPPKLFHYGGQNNNSSNNGNNNNSSSNNNATVVEVSPRKRHRPRPHHIQRPCLDFEKMQQLKARAVTAWRHSGEHSGELSVFCW